MKNLSIIVVLLAVGVAGCKKQPKVEPVQQKQAQAQLTPAPEETSAAVLPGDILDQVPRTEADVAWAEVQKAAQPPDYPDAWSLQQPSKEEIAAFEKSNALLAAKAADKAAEFYKKYPKD